MLFVALCWQRSDRKDRVVFLTRVVCEVEKLVLQDQFRLLDLEWIRLRGVSVYSDPVKATFGFYTVFLVSISDKARLVYQDDDELVLEVVHNLCVARTARTSATFKLYIELAGLLRVVIACYPQLVFVDAEHLLLVQIDTGLARLMDGIETGLSSIPFKIELLTSAIVRADWLCLCGRFATIVLVPLVCYDF